MSSNRRPLFDSSFAALVLVSARNGPEERPPARRLALPFRRTAGSATVMSIEFGPEPEPTAHFLDLGDDQTTGPLPLGFEFEFFGVRYSWFDLSSDGFLTFGTHSSPCCSDSAPRMRFIPLNAALSNFITLGWTDVGPRSRRHVTYEVRGAPTRRRLVLSFARIPATNESDLGPMTVQLVLHERTGMIDVHTTRHDPVAPRINHEAVRFTTAA